MVSDEWKLNRQITSRQYGSWRDRNGLHMFIKFANEPEKSGLFKSPFWQRTVMTACLNSRALYHIASGIGYLQSHIQSRVDKTPARGDDGISFALEQCNQSLTLLTSTEKMDIELALIACVLFVCFESLHGNIAEVIQHCLQGRNLLATLDTAEHSDNRLRLLTASEIRPIIVGQELQARCIPNAGIFPQDPISKLQAIQLPHFTCLVDLEHAHSTLYSIYQDLLDFFINDGGDLRNLIIGPVLLERARRVLPWLQHWNQSFRDLLLRSGTLSKQDSIRADILKVNHELIYIWSTVGFNPGRTVWSIYTPRFRTIVDLSASILRSHPIGFNPVVSSIRFPYLSQFLWVHQPLFVAMARCEDYETAWQAAQMLYAQRQNGTKELITDPSATIGPPDTDSWTVEEWIKFVQTVDLRIGSPVFFGGFDHRSAPGMQTGLLGLASYE